MSGPRDTSDPSSPGGTGACYLADAESGTFGQHRLICVQKVRTDSTLGRGDVGDEQNGHYDASGGRLDQGWKFRQV